MTRLLMTTALAILPATLVMAHKGHGHGAASQGNSFWHYLTEPQHAWVFAALVVLSVAVIGYRWLERTETSKAEDAS
ncbi:hypothetical protein [Aporhodopirellula aestuarii]|uniref:Secreted protein n=1 Tax=Aporhodopirellula aestuarii TaxID=2950107 RepID=A0ABT0U8P6_9BACT|nr:hypothetical protein [Aporhodopirellula aestuarii]MCM2373339.1 hypothetical protein [Aporhodopirellula aestuarii]